jgi:hypothetical protein
MVSLIEELGRREAAARAEADRLRARIEELPADLARAEEQVTRLVIAREEVALHEQLTGPNHDGDGHRPGQVRAAGGEYLTHCADHDAATRCHARRTRRGPAR